MCVCVFWSSPKERRKREINEGERLYGLERMDEPYTTMFDSSLFLLTLLFFCDSPNGILVLWVLHTR